MNVSDTVRQPCRVGPWITFIRSTRSEDATSAGERTIAGCSSRSFASIRTRTTSHWRIGVVDRANLGPPAGNSETLRALLRLQETFGIIRNRFRESSLNNLEYPLTPPDKAGSRLQRQISELSKLGLGFGDRVFFSSRRRHTRLQGDWSSDVCSSG